MKEDRKRVESDLRGRTLEVYILLLRSNEPVGVREVQRKLGMSSPSVAQHHLDKLVGLGIVTKDESNRYSATRLVDASILSHFIKVGRFIMPRMTFYASFFATFTALYVFLTSPSLDPYAITLGITSTAIFVMESVRAWVKRPW
ncbi:MAG: helix-turn-helix domain-containing protein [Aigarchaeota archaeon]|nr:helix-turn-helix domain-containing protein [Aigarchaeota archaeon]MDW8093088.1 helix-turn-helix domain-containing protein [Nitrososphaerota archaeon]